VHRSGTLPQLEASVSVPTWTCAVRSLTDLAIIGETTPHLGGHPRSDAGGREAGGTLPVTDELRRALSTETQVTEDTAPGFLVHSTLDRKVPYQNSVMYHEALKAHGVPTELMVVTDGGHGVGLARDAEAMPQMSQWPARSLEWMRGLGMLPADGG